MPPRYGAVSCAGCRGQRYGKPPCRRRYGVPLRLCARHRSRSRSIRAMRRHTFISPRRPVLACGPEPGSPFACAMVLPIPTPRSWSCMCCGRLKGRPGPCRLARDYWRGWNRPLVTGWVCRYSRRSRRTTSVFPLKPRSSTYASISDCRRSWWAGGGPRSWLHLGGRSWRAPMRLLA